MIFQTRSNTFQPNVAGAEMELYVWIGPTNVSFYQVQIMEVGKDATNVTGYFTNSYFTTANLHHSTADFWIRLGYDNSWTDTCWSPYLPPLGSPAQWLSGSYTWDIPARWQVFGGHATNSMTGWDVVHSIDSSGTVKIEKFDHWVQRTTNNVITVSTNL